MTMGDEGRQATNVKIGSNTKGEATVEARVVATAPLSEGSAQIPSAITDLPDEWQQWILQLSDYSNMLRQFVYDANAAALAAVAARRTAIVRLEETGQAVAGDPENLVLAKWRDDQDGNVRDDAG